MLQLLDDTVAWRVFDYQRGRGNERFKPPSSGRPPRIVGVWHNGFHALVERNVGKIEELLVATGAVLGGGDPDDMDALREMATRNDLATSIGDALQLARRIGDKQLGIPLNREYEGHLVLLREGQTATNVGDMSLVVLGPSGSALEELRKEWDDWLVENGKALARLAERARSDEERLAGTEVARLRAAALEEARELAGTLELGRRDKVTIPNLASLMLLVEEAGKTILLTGDGHADDIIAGLRHVGRLNGTEQFHVDVLKVQHHGSEHNIDEDFCKAVTANHYVFCGNGAHENPNPRVVRLIVDARRDDGGKFTLWFNSSPRVPGQAKNQEHMREIEALCTSLATEIGARMEVHFLDDAKFEFAV